MQTWLDYFVSGMGNALARTVQAAGPEHPTWGKYFESRHLISDPDAFKALARLAVEAVTFDKRDDSAAAWEHAVWMASLAPFADPAPLILPPSAFLMDRETVWAFGGTDASPEVRQFGRERAHRSSVTYLDLPHRSLTISTSCQIRAMFVQSCSGGSSESTEMLRFAAILTGPGSNEYRRVSWIEGDNTPDGDPHGFFGMEPFARTLEEADTTTADLMRNCEAFALLTLAYARTVEDDGQTGAWQNLPHLAADDPRRYGRKARQAARKFSLFRIKRMSVRSDLKRTRTAGDGSGVKLDRLCRVRGHFRLQPHGAGRKSHRIIWIASHERGPRDAVPTTGIVRLHYPQAA